MFTGYRKVLFMILLLIFPFRVIAFEHQLPNENKTDYEYDIDIPWRAGNEVNLGYRSGYWGFSYNWDPYIEEAKLQSYFNIETYYNRWNKTIRGPLVEGGQPVTTV